jgi:CRP-like cAMP-binding protein
MAIDALVKPLLSLPIFRGLKPLQLTEIVRRAERVVYAPGDVIAAEDQLSDAAIVIVSGDCVRIDDRDHTHGEDIPEGSIISELGMLVEVVHASSFIAQSQVRALRITRERMLELIEDDPTLAEHFSSHICGRLHRLAQELSVVDAALAKAAAIPLAHTNAASPMHDSMAH